MPMVCELRLYRFYDADLMAMQDGGISIGNMITTALYYFARGQRVQFYIPELRMAPSGVMRNVMHIKLTIKDQPSIKCLKEDVQYRQRAAFFRALVRQALTAQQIGVYLTRRPTVTAWSAKIPQANPADGAVFVYEYAPGGRPHVRTTTSRLHPSVGSNKTSEYTEHRAYGPQAYRPVVPAAAPAPVDRQPGLSSPASASGSRTQPVPAADTETPQPVQFQPLDENGRNETNDEQDVLFQKFAGLVQDGF